MFFNIKKMKLYKLMSGKNEVGIFGDFFDPVKGIGINYCYIFYKEKIL